MTTFIRSLIIVSSLLLISFLCWNHYFPGYNSPHAIYIVLYFLISTASFHHFLIKANIESPQNFIRSYMMLTALKLLLNLMIIVLYIFINRKQAMPFILSFLIIYFVFLIFEIVALQKELKGK